MPDQPTEAKRLADAVPRGWRTSPRPGASPAFGLLSQLHSAHGGATQPSHPGGLASHFVLCFQILKKSIFHALVIPA